MTDEPKYEPVSISPASEAAALAGMIDHSGWYWIEVPQGVMLGFFPQGDAYDAWHEFGGGLQPFRVINESNHPSGCVLSDASTGEFDNGATA